MTYFEPPPLPQSGSGREPVDPYAQPQGTPGPPQTSMPPPGWAPPAAGYPHPRGTSILVLGILSVTVLQILGPVAWVMGRSTLREIDRSGVPVPNRSNVQAGMVLGIIGTVLCLFALVWFVAASIMFAISMTSM